MIKPVKLPVHSDNDTDLSGLLSYEKHGVTTSDIYKMIEQERKGKTDESVKPDQ